MQHLYGPGIRALISGGVRTVANEDSAEMRSTVGVNHTLLAMVVPTCYVLLTWGARRLRFLEVSRAQPFTVYWVALVSAFLIPQRAHSSLF